MKVLITGAAGFVGTYLAAALPQVLGARIALIATSHTGQPHQSWGRIEPLDVTDEAAVREAIGHHQPTHIVHLAGIAASARAADDPKTAWTVHVDGTLNIARTILESVPDCVLVHVGSGLVYGATAEHGQPLDETALLAPLDQYAVTKAAADLALGALAMQGLRCIRLRPFNHSGPGQPVSFVVPNFAAQIARIEAGLAPPVIKVGNLDVERDFLDVRDVVTAYSLAVREAGRIAPGSIINVASGQTRSVRDILDRLLRLGRRTIAVEQDPALIRSNDLPCIAGDAGRAHRLLGWQPRYPFEDTIAAVLDDWRAEAASVASLS
jgi:GDP-4-dehydro-6-deoxy-D-mannose reductase